MASYPLGGMEVQNNDLGSVELFDVTYDDGVFAPPAASTVYPAGTILGRVTVGGDVIPCDLAAVDGSEVPIGVLGSDVISDAVPSDVNLRFIVTGQLRRPRVTFANADPVTDAVADQLRDYGIVLLDTTDLSKLDNQ